MSEITVTGPNVSGDVGHYRVSINLGDREVVYEPTFEIVGISNTVRARAVAKDLCTVTANALVKAGVPFNDVLRAVATLVGMASAEKLRAVEPVG